jgi:hypothetical protein
MQRSKKQKIAWADNPTPVPTAFLRTNYKEVLADWRHQQTPDQGSTDLTT